MLTDTELKSFLLSLQKIKGIDLSSYRKNFLRRRLQYCMQSRDVKDFCVYLDILNKDPAEYKKFLDNLSINVTEFFRDADVFEQVRNVCLKDIIKRKSLSGSKVIRAWSMACSSGQEAYSLAILIKEELKSVPEDFLVRIWGTDIDNDALETAKKAQYPLKSLKTIDSQLVKEYFYPVDTEGQGKEINAQARSFISLHPQERLYQVTDTIRKQISFVRHDFITEPALKFMDLIFCRNVMIYLEKQGIESLFKKFYNALSTNGYLVIGKTEGLRVDLEELFVPVDLNKKIFQKRR